MLKKRIAATLILKDGIVVQSIGFCKYLPLGKPTIAVEYLNQWGIDEIILLDISATKHKKEPDYSMIKKASLNCYVPMTVGGGITEIRHIRELMHCGADKISLNQAAIYNPKLISEAAHIFGNQCVVISIDAIKINNEYRVYDYVKKKSLSIAPNEMALKAENAGAGEILINSVDRDGSYKGYDIELINSLCDKVSIPVIGCGGAKNANDFIQIFQQTSVSAACAGNFFHFYEHSINITKANIAKSVDVRLETYANYKGNKIDEEFRLVKINDDILEEMLFIRIEKELI